MGFVWTCTWANTWGLFRIYTCNIFFQDWLKPHWRRYEREFETVLGIRIKENENSVYKIFYRWNFIQIWKEWSSIIHLMIAVAQVDKNVLRFLWVDNITWSCLMYLQKIWSNPSLHPTYWLVVEYSTWKHSCVWWWRWRVSWPLSIQAKGWSIRAVSVNTSGKNE